jgi:hypothetical protein
MNDKIPNLENDNPIIETDAQTIEHDAGDKLRKYPYDPAKNAIDIPQEQFSVYEYMRLHKRGRLKIDPDFQRNLVWKPEQKSRFIESIILNFPLPPFYVNQQKDNTLVIVDGLQRTTTLRDFLDDKNGFALSGLKTLPELNKHRFVDLPSNYQAQIEDKKLWIYVIKPSVSIAVVYELFDRINTGGTPLNRQEVRNCLFIGKSTELLKKLAEKPYFRKAIDDGVSPTRMKDREMILHYLAFKIGDYQKGYQGDMSEWLENTMKRINQMDNVDLNVLEADFQRVMEVTFQFFGKKNFRIPILDHEGYPKSRGFINSALLESVAYFFSLHDNALLEKEEVNIKANFEALLKNADYLNATQFATGNRASVLTRFKLAQEILGAF